MMRTIIVGLVVGLIPWLARGAGATSKPSDLILIQEGTLPIILSAPHGGTLPVPGVAEARKGPAGVTRFVVVRDDSTDVLAERIAAGIEKRLKGKPWLVEARFARKFVDANRAAADAYESPAAAPTYDAYHAALKRACDKVQAQYGRGFLIDVHGQAGEKDTIFRGSNNGKTLSALTQQFGREAVVGPNGVLGFLERTKQYKIFPTCNDESTAEDTRYGGGYIVRTYGSAGGSKIDALQMEFGTNLRKKERLDQTANDTADAIAVFAKAYLPVDKK